MRRREFLIGGIGACAALQAARPLTATRDDVRIHDPVLIRERDTFYLFGTGRGIAMHSSTGPEIAGRRNRRYSTRHRPGAPAWSQTSRDASGRRTFRATTTPTISITACRPAARSPQRLASPPTARWIASRADYRWVDHGIVVQSVPYRDLWNAIDPQLVVDGGRHAVAGLRIFLGGTAPRETRARPPAARRTPAMALARQTRTLRAHRRCRT